MLGFRSLQDDLVFARYQDREATVPVEGRPTGEGADKSTHSQGGHPKLCNPANRNQHPKLCNSAKRYRDKHTLNFTRLPAAQKPSTRTYAIWSLMLTSSYRFSLVEGNTLDFSTNSVILTSRSCVSRLDAVVLNTSLCAKIDASLNPAAQLQSDRAQKIYTSQE